MRDPGRDAFAAMLADYKTHGKLRSAPYPGEITPVEGKIRIVQAILLAALMAFLGVIIGLALS
jgi:hypothetical protein